MTCWKSAVHKRISKKQDKRNSEILNTFSSSKASSLTAGLIGTEPTTKLIVGVLHRVLSPAGDAGRLPSGSRWRGSAENERSVGWSAFSAVDLFSSSEFRSQKKFNFHQTVHEQLTIDSLKPSSDVDLSMYLIKGIRFGTWKDRRLNWALKAKESLPRLSRNVITLAGPHNDEFSQMWISDIAWPLQTVFWVHFGGLTERISSISQTLCFFERESFQLDTASE